MRSKCFFSKYGFTLVEVLGVIIVISLLLILLVPTVLNKINLSKNKAEEASYEIIYNAAAQHISENHKDYPPGKSGRYCILIKTLIEEGKLIAPVKLASTGEDVSNKSVMVTVYSSGTSEYEIKSGAKCDEIASMPMIDFIITPKGSSWVKKRTVKIIWPAVDGDYRVRYRVDKGEWQYIDSINSKIGGTKELIFDKSATSRLLEAQYIGKGADSSSSNIISSRIKIVNIDSIAPTCVLRKTGTIGKNNWYTSNVTIDFGKNNDNLDDNLSGVADYGISTTASDTFGKINKRVQNTDVANIVYYGFVKDKAGNVGRCNTSFKRDATKPTLNYTIRKVNNGSDVGPAYSNKWSRNQIKRSLLPKDNLSGVSTVQYKSTGTNTWKTEGNVSSWIMNQGKNDSSYRVIDNAGNVSSETRLILLVDWTAPKCSVNRSNTWATSGVNFKYSCSDNVSGVVSCPGAKYNQKSSVGSITVKDNAGNTGNCPAQNVSSQTQYRRHTRGNATCTSSRCCGSSSYTYQCGTTSYQYQCGTNKICDSVPAAGGLTSWQRCKQMGGTPSGSNRCCWNRPKYCTGYKPKYCTGYSANRCTSACCGYTGWSGWSGWGTGNWCNDTYCQSESRVVYY